MRIAYFSTEYPPLVYGGLGVYVDNISKQLSSLGQKISVFSWGNETLPRHEIADGVEVFRETPVPLKDGMEIFLSPETLAWGDGVEYLLDLFSYNQLSVAELLLEEPFDLVVAHDWLGLPGGMAAKKKGIPLIYHVHGLETGRSERPNPQLVALELKGAFAADLVITVSQAMLQELTLLGVPAEKVRVCYHGVDAGFFDPSRVNPKHLAALRQRYGFVKDDQILLFMGRLEPVKGVMQLFSAMPSVKAENPRVKLLMVGKGSLEEWAREEAKRFDCVTLVTDFLDAEDKMHHYALADLCVFPSLYEPFGIVALEAAAMGKPAVVGAAGTSGLGEIVQNPASEKPTGVHVNARNPLDLAWGINLVLADPERLVIWGRNARLRAKSEFSWQKAAERTLAIYKDVA
jgi:glycosyltransferase involved in cell wall biosynthesis